MCGVDPAKIPVQLANKKKISTILSDFNQKAVKIILNKYGKADLVTSHNVLAHIDKNNEVFENIYDLLKFDGYFALRLVIF